MNHIEYYEEEYLTIPTTSYEGSEAPSRSSAEYTHWPRNVTLHLIEAYNENYKRVGVSIRSFKKLFEMVAEMINTNFNLKLTGTQVNNKFKTLERSYKMVIDNNNKTGRGRKIFAYEKEMDVIFGKMKKINPEILLSENNIAKIPSSLLKKSENISEQNEQVNTQHLSNTATEHQEDISRTTTKSNKECPKKSRKKKTRNDILELIRGDKLAYQQEQLVTAKNKQSFEEQKLKERKRRNDLLEDKNVLLRKYIEKF